MPDPTASPDPGATGDTGRELVVDVASFLPDGVELGLASGDASSAAVEPPGRPDLASLDQIEADLTAVDAALLALDAGTYGTCATCGGPIDDAHLASDPTRSVCAAHA